MKTEQQLQQEISKLVKINFINRGRYTYLIHNLKNIIQDNEEIKAISSGKCNNKELEILITNKRILMVNSGIMPVRHEISIEKIDSLTYEIKNLKSFLHIVSGGVDFIIESISNAQEFMNIANEQMEKYKTFKIEINKTIEKDITDKIEKLAELYKEGILTEYEFATKKMELLEKIKK